MTDFITTLGIGVDSRQVRNAERDLDRLSGQANQTVRTMGGLTTAVGLLASTLSTGSVLRYSDTWTGLQNQLQDVTNSTQELTRVTASLDAVAEETRSGLVSTAGLYSRLSRASTELGLSEERLLNVTGTINQAFALSGATATEASNAIVQLSQGLAAGALRGDEFNSVAEQAPEIMRAIATETELSIGQLREFAATGGITAEIVVNALENAADSIENRFSKSVATFSQQTQRANDNLLEFVGTSSSVQNISDAAGESLVSLSENLDTLADSAKIIGSIAVGYAAVNTAIKAATAAQIAFNAASTANPLGIVVKGLLVAGTALATYKIAAEATTKSIDGLTTAFDGNSAAIDKNADILTLGTKEAVNAAIAATELQKVAVMENNAAQLELIKTLTTQRDLYATTEAAQLSYNLSIANAARDIQTAKDEVEAYDKRIGRLKDRLKELSTQNTKTTKSTDKLTAAQKRALQIFEATRTPQERFNALIKEYDGLLSAAEITQDTYNRAVKDAAEVVTDFNTAQADELARLNDTTSALDAQQKSAENLAAQYDKLGQSIVSAVRAGDFAKLATMGDASLSSGVGSALKKGVSGASVSDIATAFSSGLGTGTAGATAAFNSFATGQVGQAIGLSTATTGAQMASQYGLTTGVAAGGTTLTSAGSFVQGGIANAGAGAAGSLVAGALGLGSGNAVQDTVLGTGGQFIGAALGGPIGAAIGSFLGTAISGLFGGKPSDKTQSFGLDLATGGQYATEQFTGDKFSQQSRDIADAAGAVAGTFVAALSAETGKEIEGQLAFIAGERDGLRIQLDGVITDTTSSAEEFLNLAQIAVADAFEINTEFFQGLTKDGEQLGDAYIRTNAQLDIAQMAAEKLGLQFAGAGEQGLTLADGLATAFGGLVSLTAGLEAYYQTVFSAEERQDAALKEASDRADEVAKSLGLVGVSAVDTRKELRELVEAQDLTTESGAEAAAALVGLTGTIAALEDAAKAADAAYAETNTFLLANFGTELEQQAFALQLASGSIADYNAELGLSGDAYIDSRDELTDYIESLRGTGEAGRRAISELGPLAQAILDLEQAAGSVSSSNQTVSTSAGDVSVNLIDVGAIQSQLTDLRNRLSELPDLVKTAGGSVSSFNALLSATGDESYADKAAEAQLEFEKLSEELDDLPTSISQLSSELNDAKTANADAIAAAKEKKEADNAAAEAARGAASATRDLTDIVALQIRLLQTQGDEEGALALIRERELAATNDVGDGYLLQIYAAEDLARASEKAAEAQQLLVDAVGGAFDALSRAVGAEQDALRQQFDIDSESARSRITAARNALSGAQRLADQVESTIDGLRFDSIEADTMARRGAQSELRDILRTGILPDDFSQQLSVLSEPSDKLFSTSLEFQRDFFRTQNNLQTLSDLTGEQLTEEERTLRAAEAQLVELELGFQNEQERLDGILEAAQAQIDAINGVNTSVLSVAEAIEELNRVSVTSGNITKTTSGSGVSTKTDFGDGVIRVDDSRNRTGIDAQYDVIPSGPAAITSAPVVQSDDSSNKQMVQAVQEQNKLLARVVANTNVLYDSDGGSVLRVETIQQ